MTNASLPLSLPLLLLLLLHLLLLFLYFFSRDLRNNLISTVEPGAFRGLVALKKL